MAFQVEATPEAWLFSPKNMAQSKSDTLPTAVPAPGPGDGRPNRLLSLDALRGFDMFWIMGADALGNAVSALVGPEPAANPGEGPHFSPLRWLAAQLEHVEWEGFHFEDLIFPLFVFMAGVSQVYSLTKLQEREGTASALGRLFRRTLLLYVIGIFYYGGFSKTIDHIRLLGVLQRIALASGGAGALFLLFKSPRVLAGITAGILLGYWALVGLTPVRDISLERNQIKAQIAANPGSTARSLYEATTQRVTGAYGEGKNVVNHFDFNYLPLRKWDGNFDPEGILSTLPAVASGLLGILAGIYLRSPGSTPVRKAATLAVAGALLLTLGWGWSPLFPVIKKIWSSSFVLVAGGWSAILLGTFYWAIDVRGWKNWCTPFVWVGTNSITVYLAGSVLDFEALASRFVGGEIKGFLDQSIAPGLGTLVLALTGLGLVLLLARFLYRRQIFLRV